ncbi:uncharacterized protein KY384_002501 [Bacidia gigantensis]|uniref:uncharacterized protein n=1 Tax=Bacidia gigantensis TaxID=2732470 RepID=UPI001D041371|nr:uncharacterized protein KY384_002501 [Bacidia gigantensis]KAG8532624.1 hypothetical protein KY384_002501 [Bacidia gigantensis]
MPGGSKRKWRLSSRSLFGLRNHDEISARDCSLRETSPIIGYIDNDCPHHTAVAASLVPHASNIARRLRNGLKHLDVINMQRDTDITITNEPLKRVGERENALATTKSAASSQLNIAHAHVLSKDRLPLDSAAECDGLIFARYGSHGHEMLDYQPRGPIAPLAHGVNIRYMGHSSFSQNPLTSGLAHHLSHKINSTFGNPTIVHRPHLRGRPSRLSLPTKRTKRTNQAKTPDASSPNVTASVSGFQYSTSKTSLEPDSASVASIFQGDQFGMFSSPIPTSTLGEDLLPPIKEHPLKEPTIVTVEMSANAKIYFETHYDPLLAGISTPRSVRRKVLEHRLRNEALPEESQERERKVWANEESTYLRHSRVQKTKLRTSTSSSATVIAGFEVVRVLGKGSFGVVRLVREKHQDSVSRNSSIATIAPMRTTVDHGRSPSSIPSTVGAACETNHKRPLSSLSSDNAGIAVFAMKVIRKSHMLRNCQEGHLRAERDFLVASEKSKWVVPLVASFQDNTNLYLVMEYMIGGDFLGLLFRRNVLKERHARWYLAEMILCVEETHRHGWIHRDIKPDNFLISASGHIKISDFGLAFDGHWSHDQRFYKDHRAALMEKLGIRVKGDYEDQKEDAKRTSQMNAAKTLTSQPRSIPANVDGPSSDESILQWRNRECKRKMAASIVGTSQYMAPEVIRGELYDGRCDWWSLGIILYEPQHHHSFLSFPSEREYKVSCAAIEFMRSVLHEKHHRLCSRKYLLNDYQHSKQDPCKLINKCADPNAPNYKGRFVYSDDASDIKTHPFFERIVWDRLHLTRPPFVPDTAGQDDTKYFDEEDPISDNGDISTQSDSLDANQSILSIDGIEQRSNPSIGGVDGQHECFSKRSIIEHAEAPIIDGRRQTQHKVKKRARDKVLRDHEVGRRALEVRKKGVFIGYTYRRPKQTSLGRRVSSN